jgi:hypothetical protein
MKQEKAETRASSHIPEGSVFFEKVVPALLVLMGVVMAALILFAACVLLGIVRF